MKKSTKIIAVSILILLLIITIVPAILKHKVERLMVEEVESATDYQVKYETLSISFFKHFPRLKVDVKSFLLESPTETVLEIAHFKGELSLGKILHNELELVSAELIKPKFSYYSKGRMEQADEKSSSKIAVKDHEDNNVALSSFKINSFIMTDGEFYYMGLDSLEVSCLGVDFQTEGQFDMDQLLMSVNLSVASVNYGTPGFSMKNIPLSFGAKIQYMTNAQVLTFKENNLKLGGFETSLLGQISLVNQADFALTFSAPQTDIKSVLAFFPRTLIKDVDKLEANGDVNLNGYIKGKLVNAESLPAFGIDLTVANAWFKYAHLSDKVEKINVLASVTHPVATNADSTEIKIDNLAMYSGENYLEAQLDILTPVSDIAIKGRVKSNIDLATLKNAIPMQASSIIGQITTDVAFDGKLADIEAKNYKAFDASGHLTLTNYFLKNDNIPQGLSITKAAMHFTPERINLSTFRGKLGSSDLRLSGYLGDYFAYVFDDKALTGELALDSKYINLNEFLNYEEKGAKNTVSQSTPTKVKKETGAFMVPSSLDIVFNSVVAQVKVDDVILSHFKGQITVKDSRILLDNLNFSTLEGTVKMNGQYNSQDKQAVYSDMNLDIKHIEMAKATKSLSILRKMMPISQTTQGKISSEMHYYAKWNKQGDVDLHSIKSEGYISSPGLRIANNKALDNLAKQLDDPRYSDITTSAVTIDYNMADGKLTLAPFDVKMVDKNINAGGWYTLDNKIDFRIKTTVKAREIGGDVSKYIGMVSDVNKPLPVTVILTGDAKNPNIKYDTREAIKVLRNDVTKNLNKDAINSILKGFF